MKLQVYAIYDSQAEKYFTPEINLNNQTAARSFRNKINTRETMMGFSPSDYTLKHVGTFDDETGELTPAKHAVILNGEAALTPEKH